MSFITLHVRTHAKADRVERIDDSTFRVFVTAAPADGKANTAIIRLLAKHFKIAQSDIRIKRGARSKIKIIEIKT
jgi:hypothetical protein